MPQVPSLSLTGHQYLFLYFATFLASLFLSFLLTPGVRRLAKRLGVIDRPDRRKVHQKVVSRWGGMALFLSFFLTFGLWLGLSAKFRRLVSYDDCQLAFEFTGIFLGSLVIMALGLYDDFRPLPPKLKLLVQILAVVLLMSFGIKISGFTNPFTGHDIVLNSFGTTVLTLFWVVALLNAFNFIDGLDGLAAGVAFIGGVTFFAVSLILKTHASPENLGHLTFTALLSCGLAGASLGFLKFNFSPATIFMGDGGSLFLGYILSAIALLGAFKTTATVSVFIPFLVLAIPILDAFWVILNRLLKGNPLSKPDKTHIHHRLLSRGLTPRQAVGRVYIACSFFALIAILLAWFK